MTDVTTKVLLGMIAFGLLVNAAGIFMRPALALTDYSAYLMNIEHDVHAIYNGNCQSQKIC